MHCVNAGSNRQQLFDISADPGLHQELSAFKACALLLTSDSSMLSMAEITQSAQGVVALLERRKASVMNQ